MISALLSRLVILILGNLYPAYSSYKAVRTKNVKEYVKWMMYWIVFAIYTLVETFTDIFLSFWFPFYYEIKIIFVIWLLCPATKGSSTIYRRFLHPTLTERESEIDDAIARVTEQGYTAILQLGSKGVNYATNVLMQTAIKNISNAKPIFDKNMQSLSSESGISSSASSNKVLPVATTNEKTDQTDSALRADTEEVLTNPKTTFPMRLQRPPLRGSRSVSVDDDFSLSNGTAQQIAEALESDIDDSLNSFLSNVVDENVVIKTEVDSEIEYDEENVYQNFKMNLRSRGRRIVTLDSDESD